MINDPAPQHWIIVAESPFLPAHGGGELEHLGFVRAAVAEGLVAALVIPTDDDAARVGRRDDLPALRELVAPAPLITIPRRRSLSAVLDPRLPYVVASRPAPAGLADRIRREAPEADAILVFAYKSHAIGRALASALHLPTVIRMHNQEGRYHHALASAASPPRSWAMRLEASWVERDERRLERAPWLAGIADISMSDAQARASRARVPVEYVPTFAFGPAGTDTRTSWRATDSQTVVFLGALDVATNHDALRWFAAKVWPAVHERAPAARWLVVGRKPTDFVRQLVQQTPNAELHADVDRPADYLSVAAVAVNPAVSGSGVNIKLVEYLAIGVPVVSTTLGMQGLGLDPASDVAVADRPAAFAERVVALLTSPQEAASLGAAGHATALEILDTRASLRKLAGLFRP